MREGINHACSPRTLQPRTGVPLPMVVSKQINLWSLMVGCYHHQMNGTFPKVGVKDNSLIL